MEQTFPGNEIQHIVITTVQGDLTIIGGEHQKINLETEGDITNISHEGDTLHIDDCDNDLELVVPSTVSVQINSVAQDVEITCLRQITIYSVGNDIEVNEITGEAAFGQIAGDLTAKGIKQLHCTGYIGNNASLIDIELAELQSIGNDLELNNVTSLTFHNVGNDLQGRALNTMQGVTIGNDCSITESQGAAITLTTVGNDLSTQGVAHLIVANVHNECYVYDHAQAVVMLSNVGNDLTIAGGSQLQIGQVGGSCTLQDIQGNVMLAQVGEDAIFTGVGGDLQTGNIGADAQFKGLHGNIAVRNIGADALIQADFPPDSRTQFHIGGDARLILPEQANLTIQAIVKGDLQGQSVVSRSKGSQATLVYGTGSAHLSLQVNGDLSIQSTESPKSSSTSSSSGSWQSSAQNWMGQDMDRFGQDLHREINETVNKATASIHQEVTGNMSRQFEKQQRKMEKQRQKLEEGRRRMEEQSHRMQEKATHLNVRLSNREWHMDSQRLEHILEEAQRATADGIHGAQEAVQQAMKNLHITPFMQPMAPIAPMQPMKPMQPMAPMAPMQPMAPMKPMQPMYPTREIDETADLEELDDLPSADAVYPQQIPYEHTVMPTQSTQPSQLEVEEKQPPNPVAEPQSGSVNIEQEREAILRMIAEGRITSEEGDMLLEALG